MVLLPGYSGPDVSRRDIPQNPPRLLLVLPLHQHHRLRPQYRQVFTYVSAVLIRHRVPEPLPSSVCPKFTASREDGVVETIDREDGDIITRPKFSYHCHDQ